MPGVSNIICDISVHSTRQGDIFFSDSESFLTNKAIPTIAVSTEIKNAEMALQDVTYKSFISAGGEVEIKDFSLLAEASLMLPKDEEVNNTCEAECMDNSVSMIEQSCCTDHIEHPYHNTEMKDASLVDDKATETSPSSQDFEKLKDKTATDDFIIVTRKPLVCEGGEVQISDVTMIQDETIPIPRPAFSSHLEHSSLNTENLSLLSHQGNVEHADHPYCCGTNNDAVPPSGFEEHARDITFKYFNCTGGEIQISDGTKPEDETVSLPAEQISAYSESFNYDPSISTTVQDAHHISEHLDHPYCYIKMDLSLLKDNSGLIQEALPDVHDTVEGAYCVHVSPDDQIKKQVHVKSSSLKSSGIEIEESDVIPFSQKGSSLPEDQVLIFPAMDYNINTPNRKDQIEEKFDKLSNNSSDMLSSNLSELHKPSQLNESRKESVHKSCNSPMEEKDFVLPSSQPRPELSGCSQDVTSAQSCTPEEENEKHVSQEHVDIGPHQISEAKDSAIGASGNAAGLCNSAEKPDSEIISDVLKVLSECPSVASALQLVQLSPVVRRASLFLSEAKKDAPADPFVNDDSALEVDKSLLANVDINPAGLWAEQLMSPMPQPLLNSTAVASKYQPSVVTEPVENVDQKPCVVPQPMVQKPVEDTPLIPDGPLQQQLRQMAEFLLLASGKINPGPACAPLLPPTFSTGPSTQAAPVGSHSACVGTTPVKFTEHSMNTSGQFERKRDFSMVDTCTLTDPLLWK